MLYSFREQQLEFWNIVNLILASLGQVLKSKVQFLNKKHEEESMLSKHQIQWFSLQLVFGVALEGNSVPFFYNLTR